MIVPNDQRVKFGESVRFQCALDDQQPVPNKPSYTWTFNGLPLAENKRFCPWHENAESLAIT